MPTPLIALHGFTQNGAVLRDHLAELMPRMPGVELVCPDGPHVCAEESVERLHSFWNVDRASPPHLCWWDATDDGRLYRGWEASRRALTTLLREHPNAGLLGFSQGAAVAATAAALSDRGELPAVAFVVLVAGSVPRADALKPLFDTPIHVPSLHVWGERDVPSVARSPGLAASFAEATRRIVTWDGPHTVPTRGPASDAIAEFVRERMG